MQGQFYAIAIVLILGLACRQAGDAKTASDTPKSLPPSAVPPEWSALGVPTSGLVRILPESNEHGIYADYSDRDEAVLLDEMSQGLAAAGYSQVCTAVDGHVVGFSNGHRQLALKIDLLPQPYLSLFDAEGKEPLLHGLCFGRYRAGPSRTLTQEEKEAFIEQFEEAEDEETPE
jgi:hypothetical protein